MKVGIDFGGSHIALGLIDSNNEIIKYYEKDFTAEDKKEIIHIIENFIINHICLLEKEYVIEHIGVAVPGATNNGVIVKTVNLEINNYDIASSLKNLLKNISINNLNEISINVRNDAKCACIAEYYNMVKKDKKLESANIVFLSIGTGIGGGVIYNGKLLQGHQYDGYELGHIVIKENGIPCKCGNYGCFERYGSILDFKNKVKERLDINSQINGDELRKIMEQRREEYRDIEEIYILDLAIGISNLINIFEPDIVVLGGGFTHFSYMFENKIKDKIINSNFLFNKRANIDLRTAELGNNAGIIGSVL